MSASPSAPNGSEPAGPAPGTATSGVQASRDVAESARETTWDRTSFMRAYFEGRFDLSALLDPPRAHPTDPDEEARARDFLERLEAFAREHIDGDAIDRDGWVPDAVLDGLRELGAFGIKIPERYGGLGLSQKSYARALELVSTRCASTGAFLSAHQSIGVPQPLMLFGTEAQKEHYLPRIARGALSAFALTEPEVGSDPANLATSEARLSDDGSHWILNGEKLWCTNGPRAELMVVMARTPAREGVRGKRPITAFLVETAWEGVETIHLCSFMGLRGISNGVLRFRNVKVPVENVIGGEGDGLRMALVTLNTGRLSLPAFCTAPGKVGLGVSRRWAANGSSGDSPSGGTRPWPSCWAGWPPTPSPWRRGCELTSELADLGPSTSGSRRPGEALAYRDRLAHGQRCLQIRGGRGYETADSLRARGEWPPRGAGGP
jgi:alkylation response protein AidB-like acyl-CoA dehydrogenase